ncbi:SNF2 family N-terminal domain-containing protein [Hypoxylon sp. NC1633]|nr:SNF2 family N-terminal domain-containing protein [Hypoxylon sp. NC1633]
MSTPLSSSTQNSLNRQRARQHNRNVDRKPTSEELHHHRAVQRHIDQHHLKTQTGRQDQSKRRQSHAGVKPEPSFDAGTISGLLHKIKDRFPGRPQVAHQFVSLVNSGRPARELLPYVANLFRTSLELLRDYKSIMDTIDQVQSQQHQLPQLPQMPQTPRPPQPPQLLQSPQYQQQHHPSVPGALSGDSSMSPPSRIRNRDRRTYKGARRRRHSSEHLPHSEQEAVQSQESQQREIQKLLSMPEIDIAPEQRRGTPAAMACTLMEHQKVCLTWLIHQEEDEHKKGGILADTMGLGKTISALALILAHPSKDRTQKTTLIVAPLSLLKQWEQEIQSKIKPQRKLTTFILHGQAKRDMTVAKLLTYDIVMTTYGTLSREYKLRTDRRFKQKPLVLSHDAHFYRVILDEAHTIKNRKAKSSLGASLINATHRLCMTGTPFMNGTAEIFSLIRFLQIKPYNVWETFNYQIERPLQQRHDWEGDEHDDALRKLQALFRSITLRRTKISMLDGEPILRLPELIKEQAMTVLDEDQQAFYTALEVRQQLKVNKFIKAGSAMRKYTYILVLLLRLRQACCHPHLIKDHDVPDGVKLTQEEMYDLARKFRPAVVERLRTQTQFECPFCNETTESPLLVYPCGHPICSFCFSAIMETADPNSEYEFPCPGDNCSASVHGENVIGYSFFLQVHMPERIDPDAADDDDSEDDSDGYESLDDYDEDDVDARGNLKGFVVSGDEEDSEDLEDSEAGEEDSTDEMMPKPEKMTPKIEEAKPSLPSTPTDEVWKDVSQKKEESANEKPAGESDSDSLESLQDIWRRVDAMKSIGKDKPAAEPKKREATPDSLSDVVVRGKQPRRPTGNAKRKRLSSKDTKPSKKRKTNGGSKEMSRKGKKKKFMSLAALKRASQNNAAAKAKYLKRLRQDYVPSAKIDKTMELLCAIREKDPQEKTLIFSLWTSFLDLLEIPVHDAGFGYRRYDGSMYPSDRDAAVKDFMNNPNVQVMMLSLTAGNAGLNLTAASQVIILEPFWNPFVEEQAIDRAHRIGQKKNVTVHRVIIEGTVEDRIRALQERKRKVVNAALSEEGAQGAGRLTMGELRGLFGI